MTKHSQHLTPGANAGGITAASVKYCEVCDCDRTHDEFGNCVFCQALRAVEYRERTGMVLVPEGPNEQELRSDAEAPSEEQIVKERDELLLRRLARGAPEDWFLKYSG